MLGRRIPGSRAAAGARHDVIAAWLEAQGRVDVVRAAAELCVAQVTVRRDLRTMEAAGRLHRVHGGAIPVLPRPTTTWGRTRSPATSDPAGLCGICCPGRGRC